MATGYLSDEVDSVNLYNGNLSLRVPVSQIYRVGGDLSYQFVLYYNSNVWNYTESSVALYTGDVIDSNCPGCSTHNAGAGWRLSFGLLHPPLEAGINDKDNYLLIEPDGTRRHFYESLHQGEPFECVVFGALGCNRGYYYTRDGSYLRALIEANWSGVLATEDELIQATIDAPDGTTRHFDTKGRLWKKEDRFGNNFQVSYPNNGTSNRWTITDSAGRTHGVHFNPATGVGKRQLSRIDLAAFAGGRSHVRLSYTDNSVPSPQAPGTSVQISWFSELTLGNSSATATDSLATYSMGYYATQDLSTGQYSGALASLTLPTRGHYEWLYGDWGVTSCSDASVFQTVEGVVEKRISESPTASTPIGTWTYAHDPILGPGVLGDAPPANTRRTLVTSPEGDQSLYYFSSEMPTQPAGCELSQWWNGLPFTLDPALDIPVTLPTQALYRSSELYDGAVSPANLVRRNYVRYTADEGAGHIQGNKRLVRERTYFDDDGGLYRGTKRSDFDGLGHFRVVQTESDFDRGGIDLLDEKTITTNFNPEANSYNFDIGAGGTPTGGFSVPSISSPWIIADFDEQAVTQSTDTSKQLFCFNQTTGLLEETRTLAASNQTGRDLLEIRTADGAGNIATQKFYGGDGGGVSTTAGCSGGSGQLDYTLAHTWQGGVLKTTDYKSGSLVALHAVTRTIDGNTGLIVTEKDSSLLKTTTYDYDRLSRVTQISRTDLATTSVFYFQASSTQPPRIEVAEKDGLTTLASSATDLDPFGRVKIEETTRALGTTSKRRLCYNAQGWLTKRGEWNAGVTCPTGLALKWTHFFNFDAFGRPGLIVPPDGDTHRIELTWKGERELERKVRIATGGGIACSPSASDERCSRTEELYDGLGRLVRVSELDGALTANYAYDEADRLATVTLNPGAQERSFFYDGRGFLTCEAHPETGSTEYKYDAVGNVTQRFQKNGCSSTPSIGFNLTFTYDKAERLVTVSETGGNTLKSFAYDGANSRGASKGKLKTATRHNWVDLGNGLEDIQVVENYFYQGANGGAVSQRRTHVSGGGHDLRWRLDQELNKLGDLASLHYPCLTDGGFLCSETQRTVSRSYSKGWLTSIFSDTAGFPDYASLITYHDNGMLNQITYDDGTVYGQTKDLNQMQRPRALTLGPSSFQLAYDGAGNVKSWNGETYRYDSRSRLSEMTLGSGLAQKYQYDDFGNLIKITTGTTVRNIPTSSPTNQLTNGNGVICPLQGGPCYDSAGNLTISPAGIQLEYDALSMLTKNGASNDTYLYTADDERIGIVRSDGTATWRLRGLDGLVLGDHESAAPGPSSCQQIPSVSGILTGPDCYEWTTTLSSDATVSSGHIQFFAGQSISLQSNFTVNAGAQFSATIGSPGPVTQASWTRDFVHGLGYLLATNGPTEGRRFMAPNWLGTPRTVILPDGSLDANGLWGFGEEFDTGGPAFDLPLLFTGHERDRNSGAAVPSDVDLDYMHARYYWPLYGRFTSPDPIDSAVLEFPQSWNKYSYVYNNPITFVDSTGLFGASFVTTALLNDPFFVRLFGRGGIHDSITTIGFLGEGGPGPTEVFGLSELLADRLARITFFDTSFGRGLTNTIVGFGDAASFGVTRLVRQGQGLENTVDHEAPSFKLGLTLGTANTVAIGGLGVARAGLGVQTRVAFHGPHHAFGRFGRLSHLQLNIWRIGVKGSGRAFRVPLPWR